ncbi:ketopantoate reductase family protein [Phyllobacterium zundukense]|uniref:2-dehydropantoate 2-reductase n=1 Tax=Phyllobacterium zundukense TaxID=1867719 RepID=A0ACD4CYT8_9HYPH|nr:2-dehydropantoate 2-reductase [Phyllobacterium zundukense]UXN58694.1 2-dehydropantoate 2-reductase [Phyllobacterium zundukense]
MRIAILGAGAVGGYFGARLAAGGADVTFVARGAHLAAIQRDGLRVISQRGDVHLPAVKAVDDISKVGEVDLVIVAVKLWDTEQVAVTLKPLAEHGAAILSLQNGVHKDEVLRKHVPPDAVIGGLCYIAAVIAEPGTIRHDGTMQRIIFGEYDGTRSTRVDAFYQACIAGGIDADISNAIERLIWEKYVFLVGLSATTSAIRQTIGPIRENPAARALLFDIMNETVAVGRAKGVPLAPDFAEDRLTFCDTLPVSMTSSMHHDLDHGKRMELPWLSGGVAALGEELGIPTPMNRAVASILSIYAAGNTAVSASD